MWQRFGLPAFVLLGIFQVVLNRGTWRVYVKPTVPPYVPPVSSCIARIEDGYLKGSILYSSTGKPVESYRGIPYAVPPLGRMRFKNAVPFGPWNGYLDATSYGKSCEQKPYVVFRGVPGLDRFIPTTGFSEDCLTLNVFVPNPRPINAPVMVFIHGGGFSIGSTSVVYFDGSELTGVENVIVVSMNYRLASLGFLNLDHPDVDPNCGLMDQLLALKWVKRNIKRFGGNPNEITLFGNSAGAISVGWHMLSPLSRGLFKRGIMESGTAFSEYFIAQKDENIQLAHQTGRNLNCSNTSNNDALLRCLRNADATTLIANEPIKRFMPFIFKPVIDGKFFTEHPWTTYHENKRVTNYDVLMGTVKNEGMLFQCMVYPLVYAPLFNVAGPYHEEFVKIIKFYLPSQCDSLHKSVERLYTDWRNYNNTNSTLQSGDDLMSDFWFNCPTEMALDMYKKSGSRVYNYYFTHRSRNIDYVKWLGTPHTEELRYLMGEVTRESKYDEEDKAFAYSLMRYWANFARTGDPNISPIGSKSIESRTTWPRYTQQNKSVFVLKPGNNKEIFQRFRTERCAFWIEKYPEYKISKPGACPKI